MTQQAYLVRLGAPSKGDTIHTNTCRYAQRPNALRWKWADNNPDEDWAKTAPWLKRCQVCVPPSPFGGARQPPCPEGTCKKAVSRMDVIERTIYVCPLCDWWEGDTNAEGVGHCNGWPEPSHALVEMKEVAVVPADTPGAVANAAVLRDALMEIRDAVEPGTPIHAAAASALIAYARGQSSPADCPACSPDPKTARPPHTCSEEQDRG